MKVLKVMRNQDLKNEVTLVVQENLTSQKVLKEEMIMLKEKISQDDLANLSIVIQERNVLTTEKKEVQEDLINRIARKMTTENIVKKKRNHQNNCLMVLFD